VPPSRDWALRVRDIVGAAERIARYTAGMTQEQFARDEKTVEAVCFALVVIGEAASRVAEEDQARAPEIPWRKMRGMRNIAVHEYFGLDVETLWLTATRDVPALRPLLEELGARQDTARGPIR
jgi:uncharacterized protein with HEPN domain